jgi:hypothetical protein
MSSFIWICSISTRATKAALSLIAMIASLVKPSEYISSSEADTEIEAAEEVKSPLSLQEKLDRAITDEKIAEITSKTRTLKD